MLQTQWTDVERVLDRVLDHPTSEWDAVVEAECGTDPELRRAVESLLRQASNLDGFLEGPAARVTALLREVREEPDRTGERLGAWQLGEEIGRGGMGVVYRAERADGQYAQTAAVKLVRAGGEAADAMRRFTLERQLLATLDHPGVARLLDGGVSPEGQPFLVMEYVEGEPIDAYCDRRRLTVEARLAIFLDVCEAVAHAHRHLVVHRDLKPSNIAAIEGEDGRPRVKLLDFGIAKLLEGSGDGAVLTQAAQRAFTPEYAAPEQVEGRAVTTATDVYGLGVVLFELLAGQRPFHADPAAPRALERAILETPPPRPASVVTEDAASERATTATRLRAQLAGDLDAIVAKALRKEPEARYATADALASDLRRHLDGLPVEAHRGAAGYRVRKFVGRHRAGVVAASAVFLLLAGATTALALQAARLERSLTTSEQHRQQADAVSNFVVEMIGGADPYDGGSPDTPASELLRQGLERSSRLADQPDAHAAVLIAIGRAMSNLGSGAQSEGADHVRKGLAILERRHGPRNLDVADAQRELGRITAQISIDYDTSDSLFSTALTTYRALLPKADVRMVAAYNGRAWALLKQNQLEQAEAVAKEGIDIGRKISDAETEVAFGLNTLSQVYRQQGLWGKVEPAIREALNLNRRLEGSDHPMTLGYMNGLANAIEKQGRFDEALILYQEVLSRLGRTLTEDNIDVLAVRNNLGRLLNLLGRYSEAEPLLRVNLASAQRMFDEPHFMGSVARTSLATLLVTTSRLDEAERLYEQAIAINGEAMPPGSETTAPALMGLGDVYLARDNLAGAERLYRQAMSTFTSGGNLRRGLVEGRLGECLTKQARYGEAEPLLLSSLQALEDAYHPEIPVGRARLMSLYEAWGRPEQARQYRRAAGNAARS